jgi:hypothetical protein
VIIINQEKIRHNFQTSTIVITIMLHFKDLILHSDKKRFINLNGILEFYIPIDFFSHSGSRKLFFKLNLYTSGVWKSL